MGLGRPLEFKGAWETGPTKENPIRVALVNAISGERWALGDTGRGVDNFTIPTWRFQVEHLTPKAGGIYLTKLILDMETGMYQYARDSEDMIILSEAPISCVLSLSGNPINFGNLAPHANDKHEVRVMFGEEIVHEAFEEKPCTDVGDVPTPRSHASSSDRGEGSPATSPAFKYARTS